MDLLASGICGYKAQHGPVAQLDRALPSEGKGHAFESRRVRQLNQSVATRRVENNLASIPRLTSRARLAVLAALIAGQVLVRIPVSVSVRW